MSTSSSRALSASEGSAQTPARGEISRNSRRPQASAIRYGGIALVMRKRHTPASLPSASALITGVSPSGARIAASYVTRTPGESCSGIQERVRIDCPCVNRKGCVPSAVCSGASHCIASEPAVVA